MRRRSGANQAITRAGRRLVALGVCLAALLVACAPKRVIHGVAVRGDDPPPVAELPVGLAPPAEPPREEPTPTTPANVTVGMRAASLAQEQLGKPYQWGASGPDRFDCSGLVQHVFGELGFALPRVAREQATVGSPVGMSQLQPGDLVFFAINGGGIDHVGIWVGGSQFVHAPRSTVPVTTETLDNAWWRRRFRTARRLG